MHARASARDKRKKSNLCARCPNKFTLTFNYGKKSIMKVAVKTNLWVFHLTKNSLKSEKLTFHIILLEISILDFSKHISNFITILISMHLAV